MTWEPELEELRRRRALAHELGGEERVARQRAAGKLTVRERIDARRSTTGRSTRRASSRASARTTTRAS